MLTKIPTQPVVHLTLQLRKSNKYSLHSKVELNESLPRKTKKKQPELLFFLNTYSTYNKTYCTCELAGKCNQ